VASSARGTPRFTRDIDLVAMISADHAEALVRRLGANWYADVDAVRDAVRRGRAFNVIFIPLSYKFDLFPATTPFHQSQIERATNVTLPLEGESVECPVTSAEDVILAKLVWLKMAESMSERQHHDIDGVISANPNLDLEYISRWANELDVTKLLQKFLR